VPEVSGSNSSRDAADASQPRYGDFLLLIDKKTLSVVERKNFDKHSQSKSRGKIDVTAGVKFQPRAQ